MGRGDTVRVWLTCIATFLASRAALADGDFHRETIAAAGRKAWADAYNSTPQFLPRKKSRGPAPEERSKGAVKEAARRARNKAKLEEFNDLELRVAALAGRVAELREELRARAATA